MKKPVKEGVKIRNVRAYESKRSDSSGHHIVVEGEVSIGIPEKKIEAKESTPQGINPSILNIDFKLTPAGKRLSPAKWRKIMFEKAIPAGRFSTIDLLLEGENILTLEVGGGTQKWP